MTEKDKEIQELRIALELAKKDLRNMALSNSHGRFCKHWNECYYKCSNDCIKWEWRYNDVCR